MASQKRGGGFHHYGHDQRNKKYQPSSQRHNAPSQPELSPKDMQTGLVALLDRFVAEETTAGADKETLYHAHELRRRLCARDDGTSSHAKRELDNKRPDKAVQVAIPPYVDRKVRESKDLPPLPPISEPHLHQAVFTHRSAIYDPSIPGSSLGEDLSLDYERLELLGDAYIELIASRALYNRFPHVDVPELCMWRERLVENSTLGKFSHAYGFPDRLKHRALWDKNIDKRGQPALALLDPDHHFRAPITVSYSLSPQFGAFCHILPNCQLSAAHPSLVSISSTSSSYFVLPYPSSTQFDPIISTPSVAFGRVVNVHAKSSSGCCQTCSPQLGKPHHSPLFS